MRPRRGARASAVRGARRGGAAAPCWVATRRSCGPPRRRRTSPRRANAAFARGRGGRRAGAA
eukprot:4759442-Lingulodinium_polyedra.AAC.1